MVCTLIPSSIVDYVMLLRDRFYLVLKLLPIMTLYNASAHRKTLKPKWVLLLSYQVVIYYIYN